VDHLQERHLLAVGRQVVREEVLVSLGDALGSMLANAGAARFLSTFAESGCLVARRFLASQLALGLGAKLGSLALPGTLGLLAQRRAVGLGGGASGAADGGAADGLASGAVFHLAHFLRAADRADGLLTVNFALSTLGRLAVHLALRACADRVAFGRADGIVAQPFALRVALGGGGHGQRDDQQGKYRLHLE